MAQINLGKVVGDSGSGVGVSILDFEDKIPNKADPKADWNWSPALQSALNTSPPGTVINIPNGSYKMNSTIVLKDQISIHGENRKNTILLFQGVNGFTTTEKIEYPHLRDLKIVDQLRNANSIGIEMLFYAQYHRFRDLWIEGFGMWGIYQEGGLQFQFEELQLVDNGRKTATDGGSIFIKDMPSGNDSVSTTGVLRSIYMLDGGKYGLKLYRNYGTVVINLIVEYHHHAVYVEQGKSTFYNFYEEENTGELETVWLHDTQTVFITPHFHGRNPIKRTWSGEEFTSRATSFIDGKDMEARYIKAQQFNLGAYSAMTEDIEGGLRRAEDGSLEYRNRTGWSKVGTQDIRIYAEGTTVPVLPNGAIALIHEV